MSLHPVKSSNKPKLLMIAVPVLLVAGIATFVTFIMNHSANRPKAFFARSLNDASYDCEDKIDKRFKNRLINKSFDSLSSRYDAQNKQYVIYYRISISSNDEDNNAIHSNHLAKCVVWEKLGYVSDFEIMDI